MRYVAQNNKNLHRKKLKFKNPQNSREFPGFPGGLGWMKIDCRDRLYDGNWTQESRKLEDHGKTWMRKRHRVTWEEVNRIEWHQHVA